MVPRMIHNSDSQLSNAIGQTWVSIGNFSKVIGQDSVADILQRDETYRTIISSGLVEWWWHTWAVIIINIVYSTTTPPYMMIGVTYEQSRAVNGGEI